MKIVIVGASGKIGREVDRALRMHHEIIKVGARSGDLQCDYTDPVSIDQAFDAIGIHDALVCVAGSDSTFSDFDELTDDDYRYGFERKFLGQVRLLRQGMSYISDGGSFTFSTGFLSHYPNRFSIATGPLNAAVDTFVANTAPLLPRNVRINAVSPAPIIEPGQEREGVVTAARCAQFYVNAIEGDMTGTVLRAWGGLDGGM